MIKEALSRTIQSLHNAPNEVVLTAPVFFGFIFLEIIWSVDRWLLVYLCGKVYDRYKKVRSNFRLVRAIAALV